MTATLTDDELLDALRQALALAEADMSDAARRCQRYGAALDALGASSIAAPPAPVSSPQRTDDEVTPRTDEQRRSADRERKRRARAREQGTAVEPEPVTWATKYDRDKVVRVATEAHDAGKPMAKTVGEAFGISKAMGQYLISDCRRRGMEIPARTEAGSGLGPIGKLPVDQDAARDAAGGPRTTIPPANLTGFGKATPAPTAADPTLSFSLDDARAAIAEAPL